MNKIYDLIYSRADGFYIAVPRDPSGKVTKDLSRFDSAPPSALYACTGIPTEEINEVLARHKNKHGEPLVDDPRWVHSEAGAKIGFEGYSGHEP